MNKSGFKNLKKKQDTLREKTKTQMSNNGPESKPKKTLKMKPTKQELIDLINH